MIFCGVPACGRSERGAGDQHAGGRDVRVAPTGDLEPTRSATTRNENCGARVPMPWGIARDPAGGSLGSDAARSRRRRATSDERGVERSGRGTAAARGGRPGHARGVGDGEGALHLDELGLCLSLGRNLSHREFGACQRQPSGSAGEQHRILMAGVRREPPSVKYGEPTAPSRQRVNAYPLYCIYDLSVPSIRAISLANRDRALIRGP